MKNSPANWDELYRLIHSTLCEKENLIPEQFPLEYEPLMRQNRFCGMEFFLFGPRQIRLGAVWSTENNSVFFYDTRGVRYRIEKLTQRIPTPKEALTPCPA